MAVILPKPNVPFLLEKPDLVTPQWYEKLKQVADQSGGGPSLVGASEADAIAGTDNSKYSTPLRVADAIKGYAFPVRAGGLARTIVDRARDWIVVNDFSDGTGSASNDLAALNAAWAAWKADPSKGILITRPFAPSGTWVLSGNSGTFGQGALITSTGRMAKLTAGASMTNLVEVDSSMLYTFLTIEGIDFADPSTSAATNAIHSNKGNTSYHLTIKDCCFANFTGRCINIGYLCASTRVIDNFAASCGFFLTLRGGNYECMANGNELTNVGVCVQLLRPSGGLQVEGFKYFHNTHLICTTSVYMAGSYMCWIKDNMFGSHRGSGNGVWIDSSSYPNTENQICGNFIGGEGYGNFGIVVTGTGAACQDNHFVANALSEWPVAGISISGSGNDNYIGQIVKDNVVRYNTGSPSQAGIVMDNTPAATVQNNHCYTNGSTAMILSGTSTGSTYGYNVFRNGGLSVGGSGWSSEGANR